MTRINVVPVTELCDEHLRAEYRELTRIPNHILKVDFKPNLKDLPNQYVLGTGHVRFFYNKLWWLRTRYLSLIIELRRRGFSCEDRWPLSVNSFKNPELFGWYHVTNQDLELNRLRIIERWPKNAHYYRTRIEL